MPQQFDAGDDAILAERKSTHAMVAGRTQPTRALVALNNRWILSMVATVHHLKNSDSSTLVMAFAIRFGSRTLLLLLIGFVLLWSRRCRFLLIRNRLHST